MNQERVDQVVNYLRENGQLATVENIVSAVGPAAELNGTDLEKAMKEIEYVNGMSTEQAKDYFLETTYPQHRVNIERATKVPLYQHEYDALADITYNRDASILDLDSPKRNPGGHYSEWLNRGRYYYTGNNCVRNLARTMVPLRRDSEAGLFLNGNYAPQALNQRDYQIRNRTPWEQVELDD